MEMYRSGHNEADSKSVSRHKPARGFESHRLRQLNEERKMNTKLKERIKLSIAIAVLAVIIIVVLMIVVQYQVEGETNMPFKLSKITVISTAEGEEKTGEEQTNKWDLTVNQNNDIYFFIEQNGENTKEEDLLESVTIENIVVTKQPVKGEVKTYMPNSGEGRTFTYDDQYLVQNSLEYTGSKNNNPKTLEIGSKGGSAIIRFSNTCLLYTSDAADEL